MSYLPFFLLSNSVLANDCQLVTQRKLAGLSVTVVRLEIVRSAVIFVIIFEFRKLSDRIFLCFSAELLNLLGEFERSSSSAGTANRHTFDESQLSKSQVTIIMRSIFTFFILFYHVMYDVRKIVLSILFLFGCVLYHIHCTRLFRKARDTVIKHRQKFVALYRQYARQLYISNHLAR